MKKTGAQIITTLLERHGIDTVAGIPGGANLPLYDALATSRIRHVLARHEQGAGFIAQGIARATGRAAVCLGTSGPGATNLVTAIADAKLDSVPLVAITGQVPTTLIGTDAFQEVDTIGITTPITKQRFFARSAAELLDVVPSALSIAQSGRMGPVVIDVPKDVQCETVDVKTWPDVLPRTGPPSIDDAALRSLATLIDRAERPVLYVGGGVIASGASQRLRTLAERADLFVTCTLNALGAFPSDHPLALGMLGMHGAPYTNLALDETDLLIALGARFDDRATGKASEFCPRALIAHVDIDASEIGKIKTPDVSIVGDVDDVLERLLPLIARRKRSSWRARIENLRREEPMASPTMKGMPSPTHFLRALASFLPADAIITTDVGQHQMWVAQAYPFSAPRTLQTSGGLGTMGFGLPAAIGASLARPATRVVCVTGDGSLLMNVQELVTLAELNLPITIVLLNNGHLGLVRQQQELFYGGRYHASRFHREPDFAALARACGIAGIDLATTSDPLGRLAELLSIPGPTLVNVPIDPEENVLPMVPPGEANRMMLRASKPNRGGARQNAVRLASRSPTT